jgi:hypothetical protein
VNVLLLFLFKVDVEVAVLPVSYALDLVDVYVKVNVG